MIAVDSSALFAIIGGEQNADALALRLASAQGVRISAATWVELSLVVASRLGQEGLQRLDALIAEASIETVAFDSVQAAVAIDAHQRFGKRSGSPARLNLGDCFSYALAKSLGLPLLYIGDDFVHTDLRSAMAA